ncbi:MAG: hypothetical protein ACE5G5_03350 [Candidatus Methylomirabilales bacterium]
MQNAERFAKRLHLAFQLEGLPVGAIQVRPHHPDQWEVEIDGRGPFILSPSLVENSDPEGGYVSEGLRDWIDQVYLKIRCQGTT